MESKIVLVLCNVQMQKMSSVERSCFIAVFLIAVVLDVVAFVKLA